MILLLGCSMGPSEETLFDTLQVVATVAEPPEVAPGEAVSLTSYVVDPEGLSPDVWTWTCTPWVDGCLEAAAPETWAQRGEPVDGVFDALFVAPPQIEALFEDSSLVLPVLVWTLACAPGACPSMETEGDARVEALSDPIAWIDEVAIPDVSLTLSSVDLSVREERAINPQWLTTPAPPAGEPGATVELEFVADMPGTLWGYATASGFEEPAVELDDTGAAILRLVLPEEGTAEVYVVLVAEAGGTAVWRASAGA